MNKDDSQYATFNSGIKYSIAKKIKLKRDFNNVAFTTCFKISKIVRVIPSELVLKLSFLVCKCIEII